MDEEAGVRAVSDGYGWKEQGNQAPQGPLMSFFAEAIHLEAALLTEKEILCEFERIMREEQLATAMDSPDDAFRVSSVCRRLSGIWKTVLTSGGRWLSKDGRRTQETECKEASATQSGVNWAAKNERLHGMVMDMLGETQRALDKLYAGSGFAVRYRTLPALVCIYEYFLTGRCNTLSGGAGAYSVFDAEVRAGTAAAQADEAWARREAIGRKHPLLGRRLEQIHETAKGMAQEAARAGEGEELAQLPVWSAFMRGIHHEESWQKLGEKQAEND